MFAGSSFVRLVEKATSQLLLEPDWDSTMQICDTIRQTDVQAKFALQTIKKKINQDNPHVTMFALYVMESCVKNCGSVIQDEVATKDFMEFLKDLVKKRPDPVKAKILELVQVWSNAFRKEPNYKVVEDTYHLMKMEGYTFPTLNESDVMFNSEAAPDWKDGECCHRCRVGFTTFQRKHHCRNCGNVVCNKCSSKNSIIPKFGLEREVRVCDSCYEEINGPGGKKDEESLPSEYLNSPLSKQAQVKPNQPPAKCDREAQEEDDLQLAIALSMSEANNKKEGSKHPRSNVQSSTPATTNNALYSAPKVTIDTSDMGDELARYLNRNLWLQKHENVKTTQPTAPVAANIEPKTTTSTIASHQRDDGDKQDENYQTMQNGEVNESEENFLSALGSSLEIFANRMYSNQSRGRSIATDSSVQTLFLAINNMHPQLMKYLSGLEDSRSHYEDLQDKLAKLKDARDALDALREEQREKRRIEQEELERQRQIQMAHKLEILRQKKHEYLEYQRKLALHRMQEQEREMQARMEQQKQMAQMRAMQPFYPQMYGPGGQPYQPGSTEGSPLHQSSQPPVSGVYQLPVAPGAPDGQIEGQLPPGAYPSYQGVPYQVPGHPGYNQQFAPPTTQQPSQEYHNFNMHSVGNALPSMAPGQPGSADQIPGHTYVAPQAQYLPPGAQPIQHEQQHGQPIQQVPGQPIQQVPGQPIQQAPGQPIQQAPGQPMQQAPGQPIQQVPVQPIQQAPGQPIQQAPGQSIQQVPVQPIQQIPGQPMQQIPGQPIQQVQGQPIQQVPGQPIQQAGGDQQGVAPPQQAPGQPQIPQGHAAELAQLISFD